ncbi:LuxR C-terminal-related transcriptional regulator [Pseudonocardia sp. Cha107L01]|uniref:LuxR C-terminal-related transcriptional regulator n=1 Tax=Pseudonocardia sp. Cha107L01 TaxID=3457576 RepID=UPI00403EF4B9
MNPPILVIDGDEMFSTALTLALRSYEFDARQLAITGGTAAILAQIRHLPAGLALLDLHLGHDEHGQCVDGVELVNPLCTCGWAVLVVSHCRDEARVAASIAAGAIGTLAKSSTFQTLLDTVFAAVGGEQVMTDDVRRDWVQRHHAHTAWQRQLTQRLGRLSPREREVLDLLAGGYRGSAIAERFVVSLATVRTQIGAILAKLEVNSQLEAVAVANRQPPTS